MKCEKIVALIGSLLKNVRKRLLLLMFAYVYKIMADCDPIDKNASLPFHSMDICEESKHRISLGGFVKTAKAVSGLELLTEK